MCNIDTFRPGPILISELVETVDLKQKDSNLLFAEEYKVTVFV